MSSTTEDKFAHLAALRPARKREPIPAPAPESDSLAELLGAAVVCNRYGEHLVVRQWYSTPEPCEPTAHALRLLAPQYHPEIKAGRTARKTPAATDAHERLADPAQWLFLDTETTGLAGGTGTYAFLVGLAWWDAGGLQVEQFFMRDYGEEHSLLLEVSRRMAERRVLVTFNGKSFDWPLLETRYLMTRAIKPQPPLAHLDLLHPARQLWRLRLGSVRLTELERHVLDCERLGWHRRDDIDSALIPQIYFDYLRGGPGELLVGVFRHNQMDLRGLAALAGKIFALLRDPTVSDQPENDAFELYGLSRLLRLRGEDSLARLIYERALGAGLPTALDRAARRELALLAKHERDYERANRLWEDLLSSPLPGRGTASSSPTGDSLSSGSITQGLEVAVEAFEQLAIYYEHQARQPQRAAELARQALVELRKALRTGQIEPGRCRKLQAQLEHRLARLARKSGRPPLELALPAPSASARESNPEAKKLGRKHILGPG